MWQMFGWFTLAAARASRQKRLRAVSSVANDDIVFRATVRSSRSSRARYTTPIPPSPSLRAIA
jgi:hypothetical protein